MFHALPVLLECSTRFDHLREVTHDNILGVRDQLDPSPARLSSPGSTTAASDGPALSTVPAPWAALAQPSVSIRVVT